MRIQHNIAALNSYRNLTNNNSAVSKNLEKLSSGYRINRAGDDAAGLAISEKMRAQITGLNTAQKNANDGISLVQTAEGALTEVHSMLNRMVELATQSANGTYSDKIDRENLQAEVNSLIEEIDRISQATNFNGLNLLDGSMDAKSVETITKETTGGEKFDVKILQEKATDPTTEVGLKTVLHDKAPEAGKTSFRVDLHNLSVKGKAGDSVKITIGEEEITLNITENGAGAGELKAGESYDGKDLADVIAAASADLTIGGQAFTATAADGYVTFEQANDPKVQSEVIDPNMTVKVEYITGDDNKKAEHTIALDAADFKPGFSLTIDGKEIAFDTDADTTKGLFGDATTPVEITGATGKKWSLAYDATAKKLTITDAEGTNGVPEVTKRGAADAATAKTIAGQSTKGTAAVTQTEASGSLTKVDLSDNDEIIPGITIPDTTDPGTLNGTNADYTVTVTANAEDNTKFDITVTAKAGGDKEGAAGNEEIEVIGQKVTLAGGKDAAAATKGKTEYDLSGLKNGDTIDIGGTKYVYKTDLATTLDATALGAIGGTNNDAALDGDKLILTEKTASTNDAPTVTITTTGTVSDKVAVTSPSEEPDPMTGTWNVQTTVNKKGEAENGGQLASTMFNLTADIVKDGQTLTIGDKTFIFKTDADSTVKAEDGQILVDVSGVAADKQIDEAGAIIANKGTAESKAFTIGYADNGKISVHENKDQQVYTKGELNTIESFDALIYANKAKVTKDVSDGVKNGTALSLQIGDTSDDYNRMELSIKDMSAKALGIADISIATQGDAQAAVDKIKEAINKVSSQRGDLGAIQNRLEHTINNLSVTAENITAAESRIRDVDMAEEMMAYTKNNILVQAAQAMLAQANQVPQGVLQLLQ